MTQTRRDAFFRHSLAKPALAETRKGGQPVHIPPAERSSQAIASRSRPTLHASLRVHRCGGHAVDPGPTLPALRRVPHRPVHAGNRIAAVIHIPVRQSLS